MSARDTLKDKKIEIQTTLCGDYPLILNKVFEKKLITQREYNNLKSINNVNVEGHVIELVDKINNKGEDTCRDFLDLLQSDDDIRSTFPFFRSTFPELGRMCTSSPLPAPVPVSGPTDGEDRLQNQGDVYRLQSRPVGLCVILNNENFTDGSARAGTDRDAQSLAEVFSWLGFRVLMCRDQTRDQMDDTLTWLASLDVRVQPPRIQEWHHGSFAGLQQDVRHGDAFICCVLSHGSKGVVVGVDGESLSIKEVTRRFRAGEQSALTNKPKVFIIQACQGPGIQRGVLRSGLEADDAGSLSTPEEADVLVAMATVEDHKAIRHTTQGSWFIQSVCQQLTECCPRRENLTDILQRVNNDVSQKEGWKEGPGQVKQMPEVRFTLRKRLVLSPPHP
ncbi:caspase-8-like [Cololabis saira]|uniref:caspase-8-like n=1 Tax=Cololabis saira TaxID=129043 RepID=UPI002AD498E0|nr:caspase-8-like [Cololabis saira]